MTTITIIITAACFFAAVLNLATENRFRNRIMGVFTAVAIVFGIIIYGYGFTCKYGASPTAILRALLTVCRMFGGVNDFSIVEATPFFRSSWAVAAFWAVHFMAFYVTASAAIATIGGKVLRRIRTTLLRRGTLLVIYGVNADSVEYAKRQIHELRRSVVFIGHGDASLESTIYSVGGMIEKNGEPADGALLRRLGIRPGRRRIEVATLHGDGMLNAAFARELLAAFERARIYPQQTSLLVQDMDEDSASALVASEGKYGYGSVMAFDEYEIAARLMVHKCPPCETISFDRNARAKQDFTLLMIGFGRMGRAALSQLVMNGQFSGSRFRADIFDTSPQNGMLHGHEILRQYDIRFHPESGKDEALYTFLEEKKNDLRCIVLCTGSEKENREIARDIGHWLNTRSTSPAIVQCTPKGLSIVRPGEQETQYTGIYSSEALDLERIDRMAMAINHIYCNAPGNTPPENWMRCDYFSRMSSRAAADFYPAVLRAAGKTMQQVEEGDWPPQGETLENLAITEHLRWCAFHYAMGFSLMDGKEYARRVEEYRTERAMKGASSLRIGKDVAGRKHACLIPWEELDALSAQENAITGGQVDYKQMDRNNILALPDILRALREITEKYGGKTA